MFLQCLQFCSSTGNTITLLQILISTFLAILFLQSGLDKLNDWKENLAWQTKHFSRSPLKKSISLVLGILTFLELASGTLSAVGVVITVLKDCNYWIYWGNLLSSITILCLFFGQRVARDYAGAASLTGYFIITIIGIYLFSQ